MYYACDAAVISGAANCAGDQCVGSQCLVYAIILQSMLVAIGTVVEGYVVLADHSRLVWVDS